MKKEDCILKELVLRKSKVKTILFGYRDWAFEIFDALKLNTKIEVIEVITSQEEFNKKCDSFDRDIDFLLFIGWSWIIPPAITEKFLCLGLHPSDLPNFRGGSPIQHQIIRGIEQTKLTLMTLSSTRLDAGDVWLKEDLDLNGKNITEIFSNLSISGIKLLCNFIDNFQKLKPITQVISEGSYYKRRKFAESEIKREDFSKLELKQIYNFIRCLTEPYPNAFIEDEHGNRLFFQEVKYVENKRKAH